MSCCFGQVWARKYRWWVKPDLCIFITGTPYRGCCCRTVAYCLYICRWWCLCIWGESVWTAGYWSRSSWGTLYIHLQLSLLLFSFSRLEKIMVFLCWILMLLNIWWFGLHLTLFHYFSPWPYYRMLKWAIGVTYVGLVMLSSLLWIFNAIYITILRGGNITVKLTIRLGLVNFVAINLLFLILNQTLPRLLDSPSLENMHAKIISCGARHSAIITGMSYLCS